MDAGKAGGKINSIAVNPDTGLIYVANVSNADEGTISVIDGASLLL